MLTPVDLGGLMDWERPVMDADELAALVAAALRAEGRPYEMRFKSDGATFVSVECVPRKEGRP